MASYETYTVAQLKQACRAAGLKGYSKLNKDGLIKLLRRGSKSKAKVTPRKADKTTKIEDAVRRGDIGAVKKLYGRGKNLDLLKEIGTMAMHYGDLSILNWALLRGGDRFSEKFYASNIYMKQNADTGIWESGELDLHIPTGARH